MKAVVWTKYGSPEGLKLQDVDQPVPKENEILIRTHTTTVTAGDCELRNLKLPLLFRIPMRIYFGIRRPKNIILGQELAGEVKDVGEQVTKFKKGDHIFAATEFSFGTYAEYTCLNEKKPIYIKPTSISYEFATTIPTGGINGLHFINLGQIKPGDKLLINGAGGSIGTYALQIAKILKAEVTCVDSADKLEMLHSIGADYTIDYKTEDFTQQGKKYDVIIDIVGSASFSNCVKSLNPKGRFILGNPTLGGVIRGIWKSIASTKNIKSELAKYKPEDFQYLVDLIEKGKIKPVLDKSFSLKDIAEAHRYVEDGHKKGNLVINVINGL